MIKLKIVSLEEVFNLKKLEWCSWKSKSGLKRTKFDNMLKLSCEKSISDP